MEILILTQHNFFNQVGKDFPLAFQEFGQFIDKFKDDAGWKSLFNDATSVIATGSLFVAPKFHQIPFAMQRGIIQSFFQRYGFSIYTTPHPTETGFEYTIIDFKAKSVYQTFTDDSFTQVQVYPDENVAMIDAFSMAFRQLNTHLENILKDGAEKPN